MNHAVACVLSYKMAELTDRTVEHLINAGWDLNKNLLVVENQDETKAENVTQYVSRFTGGNLRMTGGWNWIADFFEPSSHQRIWFCTNDFDITYGTPSPQLLADLPAEIGWWHPAVEHVPDYCFPWMFPQNPAGLRDVPMTDSICPAISRECLNHLRAVNGGTVFDPRFYRGWGLDYDSCWQIRKIGRRVVIHDAIRIKHEASRTYTSGTAPEGKEAFYSEAHAEMSARLVEKYGPEWHKMIVG